jgi:6-phosphogluconate dehydrogenase
LQRNNFLVSIGADINQRRDPKDSSQHLLSHVLDKVVQDADNSEGTGVWTVMEAARNHVSCPTIAAGHFFRVASSDRAQRLEVSKHLELPTGPKNNVLSQLSKSDRDTFIESLRQAVYASFLASFVQGLNLISRQSYAEGWPVKLSDCLKIWRTGCIITSDYIADLLQPLVEGVDEQKLNLLEHPKVAHELSRTFPALRSVVSAAVGEDAIVPALSATLDYVKYCAGTVLPTMFMEAELGYFGAHQYDRWGERPGEVAKGKYHFEWKPA